MKPRKRPVQFPVKMVTRISRETAKALTRRAKDCGSPNVAEYVRDIFDIHLGNHRISVETRLLLRYLIAMECKINSLLRLAGTSDADFALTNREAHQYGGSLVDDFITQLLNPEQEVKD